MVSTKTTPTQIFKDRVKKCKPFVPDLRKKVLIALPSFNNKEGITKLENVLKGLSSDIELTEAIEMVTKEYKKKETGVAAPVSK